MSTCSSKGFTCLSSFRPGPFFGLTLHATMAPRRQPLGPTGATAVPFGGLCWIQGLRFSDVLMRAFLPNYQALFYVVDLIPAPLQELEASCKNYCRCHQRHDRQEASTDFNRVLMVFLGRRRCDPPPFQTARGTARPSERRSSARYALWSDWGKRPGTT